jgi:hypothetical protein
MTVEDRATLRAVIVPAESTTAAQRAGKLLDEMGLEVAQARTLDDALGLLHDEPTDLLVVDISNSIQNLRFVESLADLPISVRPRQLAIFSEYVDDSLRGLRGRLRPCKVHVFLKPLHMHGLLGVLRQLDCHGQVASA